MSETWCPFAVRDDGPSNKWGYVDHTYRSRKGIIVHSTEGSFEGALTILHSGAQKSWTFTLSEDGRLYQHYPLEACLWHAKTPAGYYYSAVETEGFAGDPIDGPQLDMLVNLIRWQSQVEQWESFTRGVRNSPDEATQPLWEHNQWVATACPSGRVPWAEIQMRLTAPSAPDELTILRALISAGQFVRMGWNLADLAEVDKAAILHATRQFN